MIQPTPTGKAPESGADPQPAEITNPTPQDIMRPGYAASVAGAVQGMFAGVDGNGIEPYTLSSFEITGLQPKTEYDVFFVLKGTDPIEGTLVSLEHS